VVNATPRPLYLRQRPGSHSSLGLGSGLDSCGKTHPPL